MSLMVENQVRPEDYKVYTRFNVYKIDESEYTPYDSSFASVVERIQDTERGYHYLMGDEVDKLSVTDVLSLSWDHDYADFSGSATVKLPYRRKYLDYLQKGAPMVIESVRVPSGVNVDELLALDAERYSVEEAKAKALLEEWQLKYGVPEEDEDDGSGSTSGSTSGSSTTTTSTDNMEERPGFEMVFYPNIWRLVARPFKGFITDVKYEPNSLEITCSSYPVILEDQAKLSFQNMYRSDILYEVIHTAGMIPNIDMEGLPDEIISWDNLSKSSTESTGEASFGDDCTDTNTMACLSGSSASNNYGSGHNFDDCYSKGYAVEGANYYEWARGFSSGEEMLRALRKIWTYSYYWNNRTCPQNMFSTSGMSGNCYDSCRLVKCCCDSIGFPCVIVVGSAYAGGHGWNCVKTDNQWLTYDLCYGSRANATSSTNTSMLF